MFSLRFLTVYTLIGLFLGCTAQYRTYYSYEQPTLQSGKECIIKCQIMRKKCNHWVEQNYQQCLENQAAAELPESVVSFASYNNTKYHKLTHNCISEKLVRETDCQADYNACYELCGGKVNALEQCVRFCGSAK